LIFSTDTELEAVGL